MYADEKIKRLPIVKYRANERGTDLCFLLDDSGSIEDNDFIVMVAAVEEAINQSNVVNPRFSIVCFHTDAEIVCGPTENIEECIGKLKNYKRKKGSTATHIGLKLAQGLFLRSDVFRRLFVLTDGLPDNEKLVIEESTKLKQKAVDIIGIGVGKGVSEENLSKFCSLGRVHKLHQFEDLRTLFASQFDIDKTIQDYEVRLVVHAKNYPVGFGKDLELTVTLQNIGKNEIPKGTEVKIIENEYFDCVPIFFETKIPKNKMVEESVCVPAKGIKKAAAIPEVLEFFVSHPQNKLRCKENAVKLYSDFFIDDFIHTIKPPLKEIPFFNVLCFGVAGSGKSSFINSLLTALSDKVMTPAAVGGNTQHVTTDITRFQVSQIDNLNDVPINFFDIWGMDGENFQNKMFLDVLQGQLPEGYIMKERKTMTEHMAKANWSTYERRIHSVIFFMPYNIEDNPLFTAALGENFRICTSEYKMNPIVVVTRAALAGDLKDQEILKASIADKFNIPANSIYMFDNYTKEDEKTLSIDKKTLEILLRVIESCHTYQKFHSKSLIQDRNDCLSQKAEQQKSEPQKTTQRKPEPQKTTQRKPEPQKTTQQKPEPQKTTQRKPEPQKTTQQKPELQYPLKCPSCKEDVEPEWDACPFCQSDLPKFPKPKVQPSADVCVCGAPMKETYKLCPKCKTPRATVAPIETSTCWNCNEEIEADWDTCPTCTVMLIRPATCCNLPIKPTYAQCPKCKTRFPK